ncbi:hypothetical protein BH24CHL3_BH24CHL3_09590 [soil metagenome]
MIASVLFMVLTLVVALVQDGYTTQASVGPIVVDGDTATRIVTTHPGDDSLVIAGASGLYANDGAGWSTIGPVPPSGHIAANGDGAALLLAGDHSHCMLGGPGTSLHRSDDGGQTWTPVPGSLDYRPIAIWAEPAIALASSCAGLQSSFDGGLTWSPLAGIEPGWDFTAFAEIPQADGSGPLVLVGLTSEGGTSYLRSIDLSDPLAPVVSADLRMYYGLGGLTGADDTWVLAAMDGVWTSEDSGTTWSRSAEGLESVVLEEDPAQFGFPEDLDPRGYGLFAATMLQGEQPGIVVGSVDGIYTSHADSGGWSRMDGTAGRVHEVAVSDHGGLLVYATDEGVFQVDFTASD